MAKREQPISLSSPEGADLPTLEAPPSAELAASGDVILSGEAPVVLSAKVAALETLLGLASRDLKFDDFMRELLLTVMKTVRSEAGSILEADYTNHNLFFRAKVGVSSDRLDNFRIPMGKGIVGHVVESRQPLVVNNVEENRIHLKTIQTAVGFETRNLVAVPIIIRGKVFCVLELLNRVGESDYSSADLEMLRYLCEQSARAIEVRLMLGWALRKQGQAA